MAYRIVIENPCGRICNPLLSINPYFEYETREDACDAIYSKLFDVIESESGCEMVYATYYDRTNKDDEIALLEGNRYHDACRDYIDKNGSADHDGVSVRVAEITGS